MNQSKKEIPSRTRDHRDGSHVPESAKTPAQNGLRTPEPRNQETTEPRSHGANDLRDRGTTRLRENAVNGGDPALALSRRIQRLIRMIVRGKSFSAFDIDDLVQHCFLRWLSEGPLTPPRIQSLLQQERELLSAARRAVRSIVRKETRRLAFLPNALRQLLARRAVRPEPAHRLDDVRHALRTCARTEVELRSVDALLLHGSLQSAARALGVSKQSTSKTLARVRRRLLG